MNLSLEQKTIKALKWIIEILNRLNIDYQISGGFAGRVFGSIRELHDIDIDIQEKDFEKVLPEISKYIIYGPNRYKDDKWDGELITLNYFGQEIDISGLDTMIISNKERTKWIKYPTNLSEVLNVNVNGINIKIINPKYFLQYKKELDGEHQIEDIESVKNYINMTHKTSIKVKFFI